LSDTGARVDLASFPLDGGIKAVLAADRKMAVKLVTAGDDYEILATVPPESASAFETSARRGGVDVARIGHVVADAGVRLLDDAGSEIELGPTGYDHFDVK